MKEKFLSAFVVLGLATLPVTSYAQIDNSVAQKESYRMKDKAPPALTRGDLSTDPDEIINNSSEATMQGVRNHFKQTYGTEEGPFAKIRQQEKDLEAGRKRVARYSMTYEERLAADEADRLAAEQEPGTEEEKEQAEKDDAPKGYVYNKDKDKGDVPPRLFNNVTR